MPRRKPKRVQRAEQPLFGDATRRVESGPPGRAKRRGIDAADAGEYIVQSIPGSRATKTYRCPGCDHEIRPGVAHVVVYPNDRIDGAEERRHWHTGCWSGRRTRGLTRRWS